MAKQKSPHTQTEQNVVPEKTDLERVGDRTEADSNIYENMDGAGDGNGPESAQSAPASSAT